MENNLDKTVLIFIHGFKKQRKNDFESFLKTNNEYLKDDYEIVVADYYDGNDLSTIDKDKYNQNINSLFDKYRDRNIKVISYSFGCGLAMLNSIEYSNIKDIFLIMPILYTSYIQWFSIFSDMKRKEKQLKKKFGKERFLRLKSKFIDKYVIKVGRSMNKYLDKNRKKILKIKNKNITVIYSNLDEVSIPKKTMKKFNGIVSKENNLNMIETNDSHFGAIENHKNDNIKHLLNFIKN